jgi:hypothetical protein
MDPIMDNRNQPAQFLQPRGQVEPARSTASLRHHPKAIQEAGSTQAKYLK